MQPLNMKEVGQKVLEKNPYKLMRDEKNLDAVATELTMFPDVLTFSVHRVGANFENLPYSLETHGIGDTYRMDVDLIGIEGKIEETIESSQYNRISHKDLYAKDKADFDFKSDDDTIIVALVLKYSGSRKKESFLLLLSKPHTIAMMREKRNSVLLPLIADKISYDMKAIETLWA